MLEAQTRCDLSTMAGLSAGSARLLAGWPGPKLDRDAILGGRQLPLLRKRLDLILGLFMSRCVPILRLETQGAEHTLDHTLQSSA